MIDGQNMRVQTYLLTRVEKVNQHLYIYNEELLPVVVVIAMRILWCMY